MTTMKTRGRSARGPGAGTVRQLTRADRVAQGKDARAAAPLESHADFVPAGARDPVGLLLGQASSRVPELVPVRHGRMLVSPFAYYRGAALPMAADLSGTPTSGLRVQLCGDAHLSNFGAFASPERRLVFDVNDFDETLPGPFEWDVKRLAASLAVAGRDNGFSTKDRRGIVLAAVAGYRKSMRAFAEQSLLDVWYAHMDIEDTIRQFRSQLKAKKVKMGEKMLAKAHSRDSMQALGKLTAVVDGQRQFVADPPMVVPVEDVFTGVESDTLYAQLHHVLMKYGRSLQSDRRHLLGRFDMMRVARKVVGVGSVGTRAWIVLLLGRDTRDPLFLQIKEAETSVLEPFAGRSEYRTSGQRVVEGQRLMQAASDILLGWLPDVPGIDGRRRHFYVRQLWDQKASARLDDIPPHELAVYAGVCGWTLARAHARTGPRAAIAAYLGGGDRFDRALADFAEAYAEQNERDHAALVEAVRLGRIPAETGI